jgi:hypothetical protein
MIRACQLGIITNMKLNTAIDNMGDGLNVSEILKLVQEQLPDFGKV